MDDRLNDNRIHHAFIPVWLDELGLSLEAFRVYCHLVRRAGKDGSAYPSYTKIAETCFRASYPNSSEASLKAKAIAAVKELISYGLIRKERYDEGEGYAHNVYHLTNSQEWKNPESIDSVNIRKGRAGLKRKPKKDQTRLTGITGEVNQDNPVTPDNSVNGDNLDRLTGITSPVNGTLPKGNKSKGIKEGNKEECVAIATCAVGGGNLDSNKPDRSEPATQSQSASLSKKEDSLTNAESSGEDKNSDRPKKSRKKKKITVGEALAMMSSDDERNCFVEAYKWYCRLAVAAGAAPGDKALAGVAWVECEIFGQIDRFREGCKLFQKSHKAYGIPHFCNFIAGSQKHPTPYWQVELDLASISDSSDFLSDEKPDRPSEVEAQPAYLESELFRKRMQAQEQRWRDMAVRLGKDPDEFVREQMERVGYAG